MRTRRLCARILSAHFASGVWEQLVPELEEVAVILDTDLTVVYKGSPRYWIEVQYYRERLTTARTYYVRAAGSDVTGDGLTVATAFNSISKAIEVAALLDTSGYDVTFDINEARTHTTTAVLKRLLGNGLGRIVGAGATTIISVTGATAID